MRSAIKPEAQYRLLHPPSVEDWAALVGSILELHPLNIWLRITYGLAGS